MGEENFLNLARINVRAARDIHIRLAPGDVEQAALVHAAEVTGVEPATAQGFGGRFRIAVIALEHCRPARADFADFTARELPALIIQDRDFRPGAYEAAGTDVRVGVIVVRRMHVRRQDGDVAGDFAKPEILNQHFAELLQRELLIGAVHRCACVDDVA